LQAAETRDRLIANGCDVYIGDAVLKPAYDYLDSAGSVVRVCRPSGCVELQSKHVCIATGSRAHRPAEIRPGVPLPFTKGKVIDS